MTLWGKKGSQIEESACKWVQLLEESALETSMEAIQADNKRILKEARALVHYSTK